MLFCGFFSHNCFQPCLARQLSGHHAQDHVLEPSIKSLAIRLSFYEVLGGYGILVALVVIFGLWIACSHSSFKLNNL